VIIRSMSLNFFTVDAGREEEWNGGESRGGNHPEGRRVVRRKLRRCNRCDYDSGIAGGIKYIAREKERAKKQVCTNVNNGLLVERFMDEGRVRSGFWGGEGVESEFRDI